jgi:autotransporter-associated beta strand protein
VEVQNIQRLGGNILIHGDGDLRLDDGVTVDPAAAMRSRSTPARPAPARRRFPSRPTASRPSTSASTKLIPDTKLRVSGGGKLLLGGVNSYTGGTEVEGATLTVTGKVRGRLVLVPGGFGDGSQIVLDPTNAPPTPDGQIDDDADIEFHGGTLSLSGIQAPGTIELAGLMKAKEKANRTKCQNNNLRFAGVQRDEGATMDFDLSGAGSISFTSPPTLVNGIIGPWATAGGDWATLQPGTAQVSKLSTYNTNPNPSTWSATDNVSVDTNVIIANDTVVNTFRLDATKSHDDEVVKTFKTSGIMLVGAGSTTVHGAGTITAPPGSSELVIQAKDQFGNLRIDNAITDNGTPVSLVKDGVGTLELHGGNTYTGNTKVSRSVLKEYFQAGDKPSQSQFDVARGATFELGSPTGAIANLRATAKSSSTPVRSRSAPTTRPPASAARSSAPAAASAKVGSGDFQLTAISTFTGDAFIEGGSLTLDGDGALANLRSVRVTRGGSIAMRASAVSREPRPRRLSDAARDHRRRRNRSHSSPARERTSKTWAPSPCAEAGPAASRSPSPSAQTRARSASPAPTSRAEAVGPSISPSTPAAPFDSALPPRSPTESSARTRRGTAPTGQRSAATARCSRTRTTGRAPTRPRGTRARTSASSCPPPPGPTRTPTRSSSAAARSSRSPGQNFFATNGILATGNASITGTGSMRARVPTRCTCRRQRREPHAPPPP